MHQHNSQNRSRRTETIGSDGNAFQGRKQRQHRGASEEEEAKVSSF